jgi:beta-phosphoglucomutase-like phosphatase (HAD superfamily)
MALKAVLFDFDGTLVDSEPIHLRIWNEVLRPYGLSVSVDDFKQRYLGAPAPEMARELVERNHLDVDAGELAGEKDRRYAIWVQENPLPLMGYAFESVRTFSRCGVKLACVTGSPRQAVTLGLKRSGLLEMFDAIVSRDDVNRNKPDPECYRQALRRLDEPADRGIVFEDSEAGVASATGAGLVCYGIFNGASKSHDLSLAAKTFSGLYEATQWVVRGYSLCGVQGAEPEATLISDHH